MLISNGLTVFRNCEYVISGADPLAENGSKINFGFPIKFVRNCGVTNFFWAWDELRKPEFGSE